MVDRMAEDHGEEVIYHGNVPVILKHNDRDDRQTTLTVNMSFTTGQPRNQKVLHIQVTDESDAYLLYTLDISEDDFHLLKTEQSILVDFPTFPSKFVELLRQCQAAAGEEHPRFVAMLSTQSGVPIFSVTETNPFRQLTHLALRFVAGNDAAIKKYLAGRVADFKSQLLYMRDELGDRTQQLQETAELASAQTEKLRTIEEDHSRKVRELEVRQESALADAKKAAAEAAHEQSRLSDQERARVVERSETELSSVRMSLERTAGELAALTSAHHELELRLRERSSRLEGAEAELALKKQEGSVLREENSKLSAQSHKLEKELAAKQVELAAALQSAKDKEALLAKMTSLHEAATDAKRQLEDSLGMYKDNNAKLQEKLKLSASEITKGNTIISKLQADLRAAKGKLKLKAAVMIQQQEAHAAKQGELEESEKTAAELRTSAASLTAEKERAEEQAAAAKQQLAEAQELLRSNQQVIQWLNKELNEAQTGGRPYVNVPSRVTSFKPGFPSSFKLGSGVAGGMPGGVSSPSATGTSLQSPEASAAAALASSRGGADADAPQPGKALSSLKSRAGMAMAEGASRDSTNATGGFADYLAPAPPTA